MDAVGGADQQLAGPGVAALPEEEELVPVHLAGEAEGDSTVAEPLPGALGWPALLAEVVVAAAALRSLAGEVGGVPCGVAAGDLVDGHHGGQPSISPAPAYYTHILC